MQAESKTQSASRSSCAISEAVSKPSSSSVAVCGGVNTSPGSDSPSTSPASNPCVAKAMMRVRDKSVFFIRLSVAFSPSMTEADGAASDRAMAVSSVAVPGNRAS